MNTIPLTSLILLDIRSIHNVGSIFRTADSVGIEHIFLAGYTPAPIDRFGRERSEIKKTALGAEKNVSWSQHDSIENLLSDLQQKGVMCIAIEQDPKAEHYMRIPIKKPVAFIFGNEVDGIPQNILNAVDCVAEIPQRGLKESLNVSVAVGVAMYGMLEGDL